MPLFSVIIPTYNRAEKLRNAVCSVLAQTHPDFELLVMDDGSTDHSERVVDGFFDRRIRYDWAANSGGPATPRNRGISLAGAPWICFLDADDIWYPAKLSDVAKAIRQQPHTDVFCHNEMLNVISSDEKTLLKYGPYEAGFYRVLLVQGNRLSTSAVTVRTEFLLKHELRFNQASDYVIVEDYDMWLRLANAGARFCFLEAALGEYIIEKDNISHATATARRHLDVLLRDHVYQIQQFEPNRERLWREIRLRLDLEAARQLWDTGETFHGLHMLLGSAARQPLNSLRVLASKIRYAAKRG